MDLLEEYNASDFDHFVKDLRAYNQAVEVNYSSGNEYALLGRSTGQGGLNAFNGLQDVGVNILNTPASVYNAAARLAGSHSRAIIIISPDWSKGVLIDEPEKIHNLSKLLGGNGIFIAATAGAGLLGMTGNAARTVNVASNGLNVLGGAANGLESISDFRDGNIAGGSTNAAFAALNLSLAVIGVRGAPTRIPLQLAPESQGVFTLTARFENVPARMWADFPAGVPRPTGPINLLRGSVYDSARVAANRVNRPLSRGFGLNEAGYQVHEIVPVKFGGSATDLANKVGLPRSLHSQVTTWFAELQRLIQG
jgi:hypothetical protein